MKISYKHVWYKTKNGNWKTPDSDITFYKKKCSFCKKWCMFSRLDSKWCTRTCYLKNRPRFSFQNSNWKGGKFKNFYGYILTYAPDHPNANVGPGLKYVLEHRYAMSNHIGRPLKKEETVHHINGVKHDNRIENLVIISNSEHCKHHKPWESPNSGRPKKKSF